MFDKLRSYYVKDNVIAPMISQQAALLCTLAYTVVYIAPFYLSPTLRSTPLQSRNAPSVIRARVRAVALTCLISTVGTSYILVKYGHATAWDVLRFLGVWPVDPLDIAKVLGLVVILFVGPLYESILVDGNWRRWSISSLKESLYDDWTGYRNLVVAPASEELVFRALTISLYLLAKVDPTRIVFITPLIFGLAHVHHLVEFLQSHTPQGRTMPPFSIWISGILRSTFQFAYTSIFGFFAAFVFMRTGNLWACIVAHSFCNWQGLPRLYGRVGQAGSTYEAQITPDVAQGKRDEDAESPSHQSNGLLSQESEKLFETATAQVMTGGPRNLGIGWTVMYYLLICAGASGFYLQLWPLTSSRNALATFSPAK
ncbi:CAAX prenyl protease [Recurvomyces mirabilis]|nr:CAAX prenyl protease [Recurvomyces mirabilis]